jgi:MYXO-CTERM domain-containing protein
MPHLRLALVHALTLAGPAQALILDAAPNKVFTRASAEAAFEGVANLTASDVRTAVIEYPGTPGGAAASVALLPFSGAAKDQASGSLAISFLGGAGALADSFSFTFSGTVSAESALAAPGDPASARVTLQGQMFFYLDPLYTGLPAGSLLGSLRVDGLRSALPYESFSMTLSDNTGGTSMLLTPGGPGADLALLMGHGYSVTAAYTMAVPHGVDPDFSLVLAGTAALQPVPEPNSGWLALLGLAWLAARRRPC